MKWVFILIAATLLLTYFQLQKEAETQSETQELVAYHDEEIAKIEKQSDEIIEEMKLLLIEP